ncbi:hypothetical protein BCR44DRAFT_1458917 [Catenaria anguillulae PL171]|uniref:Ubiquitin-like domain-containing protein n=1 Tax=Catenaria anguillulae PL171 TaxID=765915 RepID=A0A1Y2HXP5_9FUNG|nr:hypothetical protein BCR44DRAFT_1458917 [Catenaria anguillulae PL171]
MSQGEIDWISHFLTQVSSLPLVYPDHYTPQPTTVRPPNTHKALVYTAGAASSSSATTTRDLLASASASASDVPTITLHLKQLKSTATATLDAIPPSTTLVKHAKRKALDALGHSVRTHGARLLIKGKVLGDDNKYLSEYPAVADGVTVTVMVSELSEDEKKAVADELDQEEAHARGEEDNQVAADEQQDDKVDEQHEQQGVSPWSALAGDQAFWAAVRKVVDTFAVEKHGLAGGDAVGVLAAMKRGLNAEAQKRA